jgi:hypothetical protein
MTFWKKSDATTCLLLLLLVTSDLALAAPADEEPFAVVGEQLDHSPPLGWKRVWVSGESEGSYVVEYVPATEEINSWREGYLAIERLKYPPAEKLNEVEKRKTRIADVLAFGYGKEAKEKCGGRHFPMVQRADNLQRDLHRGQRRILRQLWAGCSVRRGCDLRVCRRQGVPVPHPVRMASEVSNRTTSQYSLAH